MNIRHVIESILDPIRRKISAILMKGILENIDFSNDFPLCKVVLHKDEIISDVEWAPQYGITTKPHKGAQVIFGSINGNKNQGLVLTIADTRYVFDMSAASEGAIALSNSDGAVILLDGKDIKITAPTGGVVNINNGNLTVDV